MQRARATARVRWSLTASDPVRRVPLGTGSVDSGGSTRSTLPAGPFEVGRAAPLGAPVGRQRPQVKVKADGPLALPPGVTTVTGPVEARLGTVTTTADGESETT